MTQTRSLLALTLTLAACRPDLSRPLSPQEAPPTGRLPTEVVPLSYDLELTIVPAAERFSGKVAIEVELNGAVDHLWLHGQGIEVKQARLELEAGPVDAGYRQATDEGVALVRLAKKVGPGRGRLVLEYDAPYGTQLEGLYKVRAGDDDYVFTQLEPTAARQVFPGFDEPAWKTTFTMRLSVPKGHVAITTSAPTAEEPAGELVRYSFAPKHKLPTYLLAFAVGPFDVVEGEPLPAQAGRPMPKIRGIAVRGRGKEMSYALAETPRMVAELERYLGVPYPFEKLDILALPDFSAGAMENVGAITFRDSFLLFDPKTAPAESRRRFAYVMAHELAHQWFGNLVTMPWWDDLWLNEAFATFLEGRVVANLYPELGAPLDRVESAHDIMRLDALVAARRIREPITSGHDILNAFDDITYEKGASVIGMFERYVGAEAFQKGLSHYLQKHAYGTADLDSFLLALGEGSGKDLSASWRTFLTQAGVPKLDVLPRCEGGKGQLSLQQSRYLPAGSRGSPDVVWQLPVCVRYGVGKAVHEACTLLTETRGTLALPAGCASWVMPNAAAAGYYRWTLPAQDFARLEAAQAQLDPKEVLAVADNLVAAVESGALQAKDALPRLTGFAQSSERRIATAPMGLLRFVRDHVAPAPLVPKVEAFAQRLYRPVLLKLGAKASAEGDSGAQSKEEQLLFSRSVLEFLAEVGRDADVRQQLVSQAKAYLGADGVVNPEAMDPTFVGTSLSVAVQDGGAPVFDGVLAALKRTEDSTLRRHYLRALGAAVDPALQERARALLTDGTLRLMEIGSLLGRQASEPSARRATWKWAQEHLDTLVQRLPADDAGYLPHLAGGFCTEADAQEVEGFFKTRIDALAGGPRNLAEVTEAIRLCSAKVAAHKAGVDALFAEAQAGR